MEDIVLNGQPRQIKGKQVKQLRRQGLLPAVIYGEGPSIPIVLNWRDASRTLAGVTASHLISITVEGKSYSVLVRERQRHPITGFLLHVDFQAVAANKKLRASVPVVTEGESPAIKDLDGVLTISYEQLEVESFPRDLPERIVVDISQLKEIGSSILVRDIVVPPQVELLADPDNIVIVISAPTLAEVVEEVAEAEPEVIERGKKEEDED